MLKYQLVMNVPIPLLTPRKNYNVIIPYQKHWQDAETQQIQGWVNTYIHGDTPGGNWRERLEAATQLKSVRDYPEKIAHLNEGQCLLICDETSMPTVANLLENWQNTIAPIVIVVTNDDADTAYLQDIELSRTLAQINNFKQDNIVHILNTPLIDLPDAIVSSYRYTFRRELYSYRVGLGRA